MKTARFRPSDVVDFVVVGSGAAGGVMAKELATSGFRVVVLEQGPYLREKDFPHDEIKVLRQGMLINDWKNQPNTFRASESETAVRQPAVSYGQQVGGGSVHYTANYWRFHEIDFQERSRWGPVPGASLEDWPIQYAELEPYYTKAEQELGVSGLAGSNPFDPPRSTPYPLPPLPVKPSGALFERAARKLGLHPFPAPMAIISQPYRGRPACTQCAFCKSFGCEVRAKSSTLATVIPAAERTGRCEIRADCCVRKIETGPGGRVTGAIYFDARGKEVFQRARAVVVCANGAETPRLLLMSKSNRFPNGLANSSGLVGRYFMVDTIVSVAAMFEQPLNDHKGVHVSRVIHDFYESDPKRGFWGGGGIDVRVDWYPIQFALGVLPKEVPRWGSGFKAGLAEYFPRTMRLMGHSTCLAVESNSISLDQEVKDARGLPALRMTYRNHPDDLKTLRFLQQRSIEILEAANAKKIWTDQVRDFTFSGHLMGTCRMGNDPRKSVVNRDHRAHDVPNLFLVDGSSLVTSGRQQPTCTIQALAYRAADRIAQAARKGELA
ncbi:MAG: GMC family oxidoreductase [Acidobacteria bacterium]|nr:GMC family oxidoreductase [Acidobacteriota bacterium]